ncbi:diaminopimelate epimerase [Halobaculum sp. WSA2]|uniref:Diaminopimelate epimerase n=1 Tax=Halobaculum saliterrae TaxID=2073113 RepID=A0A6B0SS73_9EURY|nr:diaminopimelate epimerase [Halobaculum saliterrae]MXR41505.1 diaminopimelate epimerase [Halobaculum saliterrae]
MSESTEPSASAGARTVPAVKYHGTGNDFLVVDAADADGRVPDRGAFAVHHCDRETGVEGAERTGADGVLFMDIEESTAGGDGPVTATMTLVQPDASIAAMCGNGARCAAAWVRERTGADVVELETPAGVRRAEIRDGDGTDAAAAGHEVTVEVEMGRPSFDPADVPLADDRYDPLIEEDVEGLTVTAVDTGVPHAVAFVDRGDDSGDTGDAGDAGGVDAVDLDAVAPPVRHADAFPEGANVTLAARTGDGTFDQRTYERGVEGETLACGTGAVAVGTVAHRLGITGRTDLAVSPPGGTLRITVPDDAPATLTGPAAREFDVDLPVPESGPEEGE